MKNIIKITTSVFAIILVFTQVWSAQALSTAAELQAKISALREVHVELKAQVQTGILDIEDARNRWQNLVQEIRVEKEELFKQRMQNIQEKYENFADKNPERAELVKERIDASIERRTEIQSKRIELQAQVQAGAITHRESLQIKKDFLDNERKKIQNIRQSIDEKRQERGYIKLGDIKGEARANNFIKIDDIKGESSARGYVKFEGVDGESRAKTTNTIKLEQPKRIPVGEVRPVDFDLTGFNALQAFPAIKADINAAVTTRN
jgi:hypothetical protein